MTSEAIEPPEETPEAIGELLREHLEAIDEVLDALTPEDTERALRRLLDGDVSPLGVEIDSDALLMGEPVGQHGDADGVPIQETVDAAVWRARRIVADAHRTAEQIIMAARCRAQEHTRRAVREAASTVMQASRTADEIAKSVGAGPLPRRRPTAVPAAWLVQVVEAGGTPPPPAGPANEAQTGTDPTAIAAAWARGLRRIGGMMSPAQVDLVALLSGLVARLQHAAATDAGDLQAARQVGETLVGVGMPHPEMLGCSIEVLLREPPTISGHQRADVPEDRWIRVVAAMASGFARALRSRVLDQQAEIQHAVDSARRQLELSWRASPAARPEAMGLFDPVTGLANRTLFSERLGAAGTRPGRGRHLGVCLIDLAGFKSINDRYGITLGDRVLATIARRLQTLLGEAEHLVGRFGSDEFALLIDDCAGPAHLIEVAEQALATITEPITVDRVRLSLSGRAGLAEGAPSPQHARRLLRDAQLALATARIQGRPWAWHDPDQQISRPATVGIAAPSPHEFQLCYAPVIGLADNRVRGLEAVVRYRHPILGDLDPHQVIDLVGDDSWIGDLWAHVLHTTCQHAAGWGRSYTADAPYLSLDVPLARINYHRLVDHTIDALATSGLNPTRLRVEIPERMVIHNADEGYGLIATLAGRGVGLVVDGVGTGYTALSYLRNLPVREVKFHPGLLAGLDVPEPDPADEAVLKTMVELAHSLHLTATAQGVATSRQAQRLAHLGIDTAQGLYFGQLLSPQQVLPLMTMAA